MAKVTQKYKNIDDYISTFSDEMQTMLQSLRKTIKEEIPGAEETISYHMPTFVINGDSVIFFAAWKSHVSIYPFSKEMEESIKEASKYKMSGKGTIQFKLDEPLPLELIRKIVQFRLQEIKNNA